MQSNQNPIRSKRFWQLDVRQSFDSRLSTCRWTSNFAGFYSCDFFGKKRYTKLKFERKNLPIGKTPAFFFFSGYRSYFVKKVIPKIHRFVSLKYDSVTKQNDRSTYRIFVWPNEIGGMRISYVR